MIRIIICDDNTSILDHYQNILETTARENHLDIKVTRCESGEQLLFMLSDNPNSADMIYLDILMGKMNGVETARKLRELGCVSQIIFLTSSDEYVFQAFDVEPYYYMVKDDVPIRKFKEIFLKAADTIQKKAEDYISVTFSATTVKISLDKILYFEVRNRQVTVHTIDSSMDYYAKLEDLEEMLAEKGFVRIQRSFLVNCYHIQKLQRTQVTLSDGTELPVGTKYAQNVQDAFSKYLMKI